MHDQEDEPFLASDGFERIVRSRSSSWNDDEPDLDASTYQSVKTQHGPGPVPHWVITDDRARQVDLGL